ncbi:hypothetical protein WMY93_022465 [Mugilogobius chulae]|uniref:DH domain-containing protein n=1 Tax=Mugilogobius chulae TaxID=88201 RepID=A0AAW0NA29_9GOBI
MGPERCTAAITAPEEMPQRHWKDPGTFLKELEAYTDCPELVGRCFLQRMKDLQIYEAYCQNKPRSESLWRQFSDCAFFQECQKRLEHKLGLDSYLLKPVQRITKYQLLLKELLKYSKGCDGADDLQEALSSILGILKAVNDSMHLIAITGYEGNLSELGRLLMQGSFSVWTEHKKGHAKVKDLAASNPCNDTCSSTRGRYCSARDERRAERATRKLRRTALSTRSA